MRENLSARIGMMLLGLLITLQQGHATVVKEVRIQDSGPVTRIVMPVSGTPQDLKITDTPGKPMSVSFKGRFPSGMKPVNKNYNAPNLGGIYVESRKGMVQAFIKRHYTGSVTVSTEHNRLVVHVPRYYAGKTTAAAPAPTERTVAEGIRHFSLSSRTGRGPARVNILEIDPRQPGLEIMPALASNRMGSKINVARMVSANQAVAGINGSFFKPDVGIPLGILIINEELISGPIYDRAALGITGTNDLVMDKIRLAGEILLPDGQKIRVHNINQPRIQPAQTVVYTSRWGLNAPKVPTNGIQIQLRNNRVTAVSTDAPLNIPRDGVVISGLKTHAMNTLAGLSPAYMAQLNIYTLPDWSQMKHAIGGGPFLVRNGRPYIDLKAQHFSGRSLGFREPRSAVGITRDGKLLLVTVDGRKKTSAGMTLSELSNLMLKLGAVQAMNLDGGSSTQMAVRGKMINLPSSGNVGVSNSLIVRTNTDGNVAIDNK